IKQLIDQIKTSPACWVCGQPLSGEHLDHAVALQTARGRELGDAYRDLTATIGELQQQLATLTREIGEEEIEAEKRRNAANREAGQLRQRLADARTARERVALLAPKLDTVERQLATNAYALEAQADLAAIDTQIATLAFDQAALDSAMARVKQFESFEAKHQLLQQADEQLADLRDDHERYQQEATECAARIAALEAEIAALAAANEALRGVTDALRVLNAEQADRATALAAARRERIHAEQLLQGCLDLIPERERLLAERQAAADEKGVFDELTAAFGKRGVQAMLIEAVLPELEEIANELLARMTEGRLSVRFETQRSSRSADSVIETLDIVITDELGSRNYEMFSGGEAFRVDFALRVALAKLLARRAGAQLQTLIIDEGFGTQDAAGRERLIEAITAIEDDFEKILVVTHIEELKDAFPTRIEVVKTPAGSRYSLQTR
ncbi:MAG: SMC family ATPase, partial [Dehalococcoidia bacterium]|nr:SMC family ATPase [Dehalococcoidia bacterium]